MWVWQFPIKEYLTREENLEIAFWKVLGQTFHTAVCTISSICRAIEIGRCRLCNGLPYPSIEFVLLFRHENNTCANLFETCIGRIIMKLFTIIVVWNIRGEKNIITKMSINYCYPYSRWVQQINIDPAEYIYS